MASAFGWIPCIGPVLGAILTVSAVSASVGQGVTLLAAYSLRLGLPFLAAAAFTGALLQRSSALRRLGRPLQVEAGSVMVLAGLAIATRQLSAFSYWLLDTFPALGEIG